MDLFNSTQTFVSTADILDELNSTLTPFFGNTSRDTNVTGGIILNSSAGASIVSPIVMFLAGLIGNVLALVVLRKTKREIRNMMFYTLVAALTWNDLLGICLTSPPVLAAYLTAGRQMPALPTLCRFHAVAMVCFGLSTPLIVCAMAVERSLALNARYFYSRHCTPASVRLLLAVLWAAVLVFGALPLMGVGSFTLQYPNTWCFLHFRSYLPLDMAYAGAYAVLNLLVIAVMVLCNGLVITTLCRVRESRRKTTGTRNSRSSRSMSDASANGTLLKVEDAVVVAVDGEKGNATQQQQQQLLQEQQYLRRRQNRDVELQMIWLLCAITTIFAVCWAPLMMYILYCLQSPTNSSPLFGLVAVRLASLNQTINPWIYVILRKSLLSRLASICRHNRLFSCFRRADDDTDKPSRRSEPRRPTGFHKNPPIFLQRKGGGGGKGPKSASASSSSLRNKYVHVGNQLCPSSQFVGLYQPVRLVSEGSGRKGKRSGGGGSGGGSKSSSRSQWKGRGSGQGGGRDWEKGVQASQDISSGGVSSAAHESRKLKVEGQGGISPLVVVGKGQGGMPPAFVVGLEGRGDPGSLLSITRTPSSAHSGSHAAVSPQCSTACEDSVDGTHPPRSLPADGAYVDFFRHLPPSSGVSLTSDVIPNDTSTTPYRSQACRGQATAATNVLSCVSEADDHGYSSSSRVSTPERGRQDTLRLAGDVTHWDDEEAGFVLREDDAQYVPDAEPAASDSSSGGRTRPGGPKQIGLEDMKDGSVLHAGGENTDHVAVCLKEPRSEETCFSQNNPTERRQAGVGLTEGRATRTSYSEEDTGFSTGAAAKEKTTRSVKANGQLVKQNASHGRDDSLDFTSGVFDCRDDEDGNEDDDDDADEDDVYDDNLSPGQSVREEEGVQRGPRKSSSRTMSSSSAGTVGDSSSGHDSTTVLCRHWSSSSASAQ